MSDNLPFTYFGVFIGASAHFQEINPSLSQQTYLSHGVFERIRTVVCRVQLNADAERRWDNFASFCNDVQNELGSLLSRATILVCSDVCLQLVSTITPSRTSEIHCTFGFRN